MHTALYYPHTEVRNENLIAHALLTWDALEYIVPYQNYEIRYGNDLLQEAMEMIGRPRTVTSDEQSKVHDLVVDLLEQEVPETFQYTSCASRYEVWPQKIAPATWTVLEERGLTSGPLDNADYPMSPPAGRTLMAIVAEVLAGATRARVTDEAGAYAAIANTPMARRSAPSSDQLVPLTFKAIDTDSIPLERLVALRQREAQGNGAELRGLRHAYLTALEGHVKEIAEFDPESADRIEADRVFLEKMESDLYAIKRELGFGIKEALLSKDVITLVLAGGGLMQWAARGGMTLPEVVSGVSAVTLGGVLSAKTKLAKTRREVLARHPMAYLYEARRLRTL
jgi:hypothetical protein